MKGEQPEHQEPDFHLLRVQNWFLFPAVIVVAAQVSVL